MSALALFAFSSRAVILSALIEFDFNLEVKCVRTHLARLEDIREAAIHNIANSNLSKIRSFLKKYQIDLTR